jgi:hypothetical protein
MVRSKSEVIIANALFSAGVDYSYERQLKLNGATKYPDFTIEDMESGKTYFWEHCGMLHVPSYRRRWEEKLAWYRDQRILPYDDGGGENGNLIVTRDEVNGSIDSAAIALLVKRKRPHNGTNEHETSGQGPVGGRSSLRAP